MSDTDIRYLDGHCHLQASRLIPVIDGMMERARKAGVARMLCNATREEDWQTVVDLAAKQEGVIPFLGIHPWFAEGAGVGWEKRLMSLLERIPAGIGETGLDKSCRADFARQQQIFLTQLQMASELRRPLVIHCVKAWGRLLELLEESTGPLPPMMIHSFGGSRETLQRLLRLGCFISFADRVTIGSRLHPCFMATPLANLLLETDGQGREGKRSEAKTPSVAGATDAPGQPDRQGPTDPNDQKMVGDEPAAITRLYQWAAAMRGMALPEFCQELWRNGEIFTNPILPR